MQECEIISRFGRRRRARPGETPQDGERLSFSPLHMDHAGFGFDTTFADGSPDFTSPHKKGFRFADSDSPSRCAADEAMRSGSGYNFWWPMGPDEDVGPQRGIIPMMISP
jgi:hypothetical protein